MRKMNVQHHKIIVLIKYEQQVYLVSHFRSNTGEKGKREKEFSFLALCIMG